MRDSVYFRIHGFKLMVSSDCAEFLSIVKNNFYYFVCEKNDEYDIVVDFTYGLNPIIKDIGNQGVPMSLVCSTGSKVYAGEKVLKISGFTIPGLTIIINSFEKGYSVNAAYRLTRKEFFLMRVPVFEKLLKIVRFIIHYPLFELMREKRDLFFLHASAVEYKDKGYAFIGLPGSGKTRCIMKLLENEDIKFLSDNYLVCSGKGEIFAFPELVRIREGANGGRKVDANLFKKVGFGSLSEKSVFKISDEKIAKQARISKVFFLKRSDRERLLTLENADLISDLIAAERFTKDFYEYSYIGLLRLSGLNLSSLSSDRRIELSAFFKDVDCYELCVKENSADLNIIKDII